MKGNNLLEAHHTVGSILMRDYTRNDHNYNYYSSQQDLSQENIRIILWPSSGGIEDQERWPPGSGCALASRPHSKTHPTRKQGPDDARIRRRTQGGQGRDTEAQRYPQWGNPPRDYRDLGSGRGRKKGYHNYMGNGGRYKHAAHIAYYHHINRNETIKLINKLYF